MSRNQTTVFVLWADNFDEVAAAIFVTELRKAGLRVKVVGLTPRQLSGAYGLTLTPDLTLDQALTLATRTICLIIPQTAPGLQNLKNDPRLQKLFDLAGKNRARLVIGPLNGVDIRDVGLFPVALVEKVLVYPDGEAVMGFARELVGVLGE